ncbi:MAG: putative ATPase related to phosphate starvation-inducible protein PhoH, partial [bacterium]|nr:putative ATPase related to phosphate starvation-inducible protein PhoH [bacterium]
MRKTFVLDTNVLLHDPRAMFHFAENDVVIPIYVLEEIDHFKKELSEKGRNAREVARRLDEFRNKGHSLAEGVAMENGSRLQVALATRALPDALKASSSQDNNILGVALEVRDKSRDRATILFTKDVYLRIRADALGLKAEEYNAEKIDVEELYSGNSEVEVSSAAVDQFYAEGSLPIDVIGGQKSDGGSGFYANQYLLLRDRENPSHTALGRFDGTSKKVAPVKKLRDGVWGIRPRNKEQHY